MRSESDRCRRRRRTVDVSTRSQSTTIDYTLSLAIAALVVTGLVSASGEFLDDRRTEVVRTELNVVGQQLASDVAAADRLVQAGDATDRVVVNSSLPEKVTGSTYNVEVSDTGSKGWINLSTRDPDVEVSIRVQTETDLADTAVSGGEISVVYDSGQLEVRS